MGCAGVALESDPAVGGLEGGAGGHGPAVPAGRVCAQGAGALCRVRLPPLPAARARRAAGLGAQGRVAAAGGARGGQSGRAGGAGGSGRGLPPRRGGHGRRHRPPRAGLRRRPSPLPLLRPIGQFGSRAQNGADHAAPRYLFTAPAPLAELLLPPPDDDDLLTPRPRRRPPLRAHPLHPRHPPQPSPTAPPASAQGSPAKCSHTPPLTLITLVRQLIDATENNADITPALKSSLDTLPPYGAGFLGATYAKGQNTMLTATSGKFTIHQHATSKSLVVVRILELPLYKSIEHYRSQLNTLIDSKIIHSYNDYSTGISVDIDVNIHHSQIQEWILKGAVIEEQLKLIQTYKESCVLINHEDKIQCYPSMFDIFIKHFRKAPRALPKTQSEVDEYIPARNKQTRLPN